MQTPTAPTRMTPLHETIRRRMTELARWSQHLHLDARSVQAIRTALYT